MEEKFEKKGRIYIKNGNIFKKIFAEDYPRSKVLQEANIQSRVKSSLFRVPKVYEVTKEENRFALVMENIHGYSFVQEMNCPNSCLDEVVNRFVDLHMSIIESPCLYKDYSSVHYDKGMFSIEANEKLDSLIYSMPKLYGFCHGDFHPNNIVIENDHTVIIDWELANYGNIYLEITRTYFLGIVHDCRNFSEKYLELICERLNIKKVEIINILPVAIAHHLSLGNTNSDKFEIYKAMLYELLE